MTNGATRKVCEETLQADFNSRKMLRHATENSVINANRSIHRANPGRKVVKLCVCMHANRGLKKCGNTLVKHQNG